MEYSPTVLLIPPRSIGRLHSLTDMNHIDLDNFDIASPAQSPQPQSHAMIFASGLPLCTPASMVLFTSAIISAALLEPQRGQALCFPCEAQLVRFSDAVIVKTPPRPGTFSKT